MLSQMVRFHSFLWPSNIPLYICDTTYFFLHLFIDRHLGCFHSLGILYNAEMNIGVHIFFQISVLSFFGYIVRSGIAGIRHSSFKFWGNPILFFTGAAPVCIPTTSTQGFPFLCVLASTCLLIIDDSRSDRCEVIFHCGFNLHLSDD